MIKTKIIEYNTSGQTFEGSISWDDAVTEPRPGVLVSHAFGGQGVFDVEKAEELARMGYVAFALDMYGKGRRAKSPAEAQELMGELNRDRPLLLERIQKALAVLHEQELVDESRVAAIGFCFGGKCVLDLARSGAELRGVVSFHGVYNPPPEKQTGPIPASILVLHGWDDPLNSPEQTVELARELSERGAHWQLNAFGLTGHAFTNPRAKFPENGMVYSEDADQKSWSAMSLFLKDVFND